ncbi:MAG TPA: lipopolysaccharide assembly protein LapA domain-containing protein [Candidatus Binatia bacterium]|nr:lipopolysaccharide assembly protein LapA domain-containing protein [Candidatus Binatia bacterium]
MLALLIAVVFGAAVGYFATQNTIPVTIRLAEYAIEEVPLYLVVIGSLLIGLFIGWILFLARAVSSSFAIRGKNNEVRRARETIAELENRVRDLEVENARLRTRDPLDADYREPLPHSS